MQISTEQIDLSFQRKCLFAKQVLQDKASLINGLAKIKLYLLQEKPSADGLPIFIVPYSEELRSLFSFTVKCDARDYDCLPCFYKNACMKTVLRKVLSSAIRSNKHHVELDSLFMDYSKYKLTEYTRAAIDTLILVTIKIGEIK